MFQRLKTWEARERKRAREYERDMEKDGEKKDEQVESHYLLSILQKRGKRKGSDTETQKLESMNERPETECRVDIK